MSDLKKISAYVPIEVFNEIKKSASEEKISLSQAIILALVKAYDLDDIEIGKTGKRIIIAADKETKEKVNNLEKKVDHITLLIEQVLVKNSSIDGLATEQRISTSNSTKVKNQSIDKLLVKPVNNREESEQNKSTLQPSLVLQSPKNDIKPLISRQLAKRLEIHKSTPSSYKYKLKDDLNKFRQWTREKDPDNIAWIPDPNGGGFIPSEDTSFEKLSLLKNWIQNNVEAN